MRKIITFIVFVVLAAAALDAATFIVPDDRDLIRRADLIVVATAGNSYTQRSPGGAIETVTVMTVEDMLKGTAPARLDVFEPGGVLDGTATIIPGAPRFTTGQRMLLLLKETGPDRYSVAELILGKFSFARDTVDRQLLVRDEPEITGWDTKLHVYREQRRDAARFLQFVRDEARGGHGVEDYFVPIAPLKTPSAESLGVKPEIAPFTVTSYTMNVSGGQGARWNVFPNAVTFYSNSAGEPGAPGGGTTAVQSGLNTWTNDSASNVNYVYGGTDSTHTSGLSGTDGRNTVLWERDLSGYGIQPFVCSGNSYHGTLGIGGITSAGGSNTVSGETFLSTNEGDVEMNKGVANCTVLFNNGDFNSAVAHELGHTLGFRHSDQDRDSAGACTSTTGLECSDTAIMKSFIPTGLNAALQTWDMHAVQALYPGSGGGGCTPPSIVTGPSNTTINAGSSTTLSASATGTAPLTFQWYIGTTGNTSTPIGTGTSITVSPSTTTNYWVRVSNACGSTDSFTATVTVNPAPPPPPKHLVHGDYTGDKKADPAVFRPSTGAWIVPNAGINTVWGGAGDIPAQADYDGDGKTDLAIFRPSNATFYIINSSNGSTRVVQFGQSSDKPAPGDYDGDGKADIALLRPSTGVFSIIQSSNGATRTVTVGTAANDLPAQADYDGDGKDDPATENPSSGQWRIMQSTTNTLRTVQWGGTGGDIPVPADYDGDGKADVALESQLDGKWYIILSSNGSTRIQQWGGSGGDQPQPSDFDGDGKADLCVFNPGAGKFYIVTSSNGGTLIVTLGQSGDIGVSR